jgi:hypothetical protein
MALLSLETSASGSVAMLETFLVGKALKGAKQRHDTHRIKQLT